MASIEPASLSQIQAPEIITLCDGTQVTLRPIRPDDVAQLHALFKRLSPESLYLRFLRHGTELPYELAEHMAAVNQQTQVSLVATCEQDGEEIIIAEARYDVCLPAWPDIAEAAMVVDDPHQSRGLGTILADKLVEYARAHGIRAFVAQLDFENAKIIHFIRRSGLPFRSHLESGVLEVRVELGPEA